MCGHNPTNVWSEDVCDTQNGMRSLLWVRDGQNNRLEQAHRSLNDQTSRCAATLHCDENLEAITGGGGRVKMEARAAGAHNLDATDAYIKSNGVFIDVSACAE